MEKEGKGTDDATVLSLDRENDVKVEQRYLIIMVNSAITYSKRRQSIRKSYLKFLTDSKSSPLSPEDRLSVELFFVIGTRPIPNPKEQSDAQSEQDQFHDMIQVPVIDDYATLAKKTLAFMQWVSKHRTFTHFMHADDDSFIRIDLLLPALRSLPTQRLYWGYIWDNVKTRVTRPLRNPADPKTAKSYMPYEQYEMDAYPPFACGCGFVLSFDLIEYLARNADVLKDFRLVDVAFGIYLFPIDKKNVVNDDRVRPYRPMPMFREDTIVQHYMQPEEFVPFYSKAMESIQNRDKPQEQQIKDEAAERIAAFYDMMAGMKLLKK